MPVKPMFNIKQADEDSVILDHNTLTNYLHRINRKRPPHLKLTRQRFLSDEVRNFALSCPDDVDVCIEVVTAKEWFLIVQACK